MSTIWRSVSAGEVRLPAAMNVSDDIGEPAVMYGDGIPDRVRLPADIGGAVERVTGVNTAKLTCSKCGKTSILDTLVLETINVSGCLCGNYLWWRPRAAPVTPAAADRQPSAAASSPAPRSTSGDPGASGPPQPPQPRRG